LETFIIVDVDVGIIIDVLDGHGSLLEGLVEVRLVFVLELVFVFVLGLVLPLLIVGEADDDAVADAAGR
jgi:hypothetical protein